MGNIHREKRSPSAGTSITSAKAISIAAPASRTVSASMPNAGPSAPSITPMTANDSIMPRPMAAGARRWPCTAPPNTSGSSGNTQGESVVRPPAARLSPS